MQWISSANLIIDYFYLLTLPQYSINILVDVNANRFNGMTSISNRLCVSIDWFLFLFWWLVNTFIIKMQITITVDIPLVVGIINSWTTAAIASADAFAIVTICQWSYL